MNGIKHIKNMAKNTILLLIFFLFDKQFYCQKSAIISKANTCRFQVVSQNREELPLNVFYYTSKNQKIRYTSGFSYVNACPEWKEDTIRTVAVWAEGYFLRIIKINFNPSGKKDTLFLSRLHNDSIYKIEGLEMLDQNNMNLTKSKVAMDNYMKLIIKPSIFRYTVFVNENNSAALNKANTFLKELFRRDLSLKNKVSIEKTTDPGFDDEIYLKAVRVKNNH